MPDNSLPLTQEEHRELGRELRDTEARLRELCDLASAVYGPHHRVSFSFQKALDAMSRLRTDLQTQLERDHPGYVGDGIYL
ncbi:MAG: hypothetical protein ACLQU1_28825 [Bryobacteraceae bacterium]